MKRHILYACLAISLAFGATQFAYAGSSEPGSTGTGEKNPVTVPLDLQNAKPMPLPSVEPPVTHDVDVNTKVPSALTIKPGDHIRFTGDKNVGKAQIVNVIGAELNGGDKIANTVSSTDQVRDFVFDKPGNFVLVVSWTTKPSNPYWTTADILYVTVK